VRSKKLQIGRNSVTSPTRGASCVAAALILAMTATPPVVIAQTASVVPPPPPNGIVAVTVPSANASITRVASGSETLHLVVGHSLFLNTKLRLHRVYVADPAILNSITLNPNQIIVTAMAPGVSSLIVLDEAGQAQSYVISSDLDVTGLRTAIDAAVHDDVVNVEGNGGRVILSGQVANPSLSETVVKLATLYSKDVANSIVVAPGHPKQVKLKVRILEVDRTKLAQFGINLFNPGGNTSFLASTTTSQYPSTSTLSASNTAGAIGSLLTSNPLNFLLYSSKLNLGTTVQDLESKNVLQILAEPEITTVSGRKASFLSGGEFPFPVIQPGGGSGGTSSVTIQFKPYGVKLDFTPIVNDDGTIRLEVAPEVSALDYSNAVTISGYTIPALSSRKADTEVELRSDQSFAISGLLDQRTTDLLSKTPGAASIPILGALFKSKNITHSTTELVVIVTPTLVDPLTEDVKITQPNMPIPTLNTNGFDKSLGKRLNPNPTPPPINDAIPGSDVIAPATPPAAQTAPPSGPQNVIPAPRPAPAAVSPSSAVPVRPANGAENVLPAPVPYAAPPAVAASPAVLAPTPPSAAKSAAPAQAPSSLPAAASVPTVSIPASAGTAPPSHSAPSAVAATPAVQATPAPAAAHNVAPVPSQPAAQPQHSAQASAVATPAAQATPAPAAARNLAPAQSTVITAPSEPKQSVPSASSTAAPAHVVPASTTTAPARVVPVSTTTGSAHLVPASATAAPASSQSSAPSPKQSQHSAPTVAVATSVPPPAIRPVPAPAVATTAPAPSAASTPAMVQIMTLSHKEDVDAMVAALRRHGYDVAVTRDPRDSRIHLEVGPFKDKTEAEAMRQKLLTDGYDATVK